MAGAPDTLTLKRNRDLEGMRNAIWIRRGVLSLLTLVLVLGLLNVFGQRPFSRSAAMPLAKLTVYAPTHLRGGLLYSARFHVAARQGLKKATLVLDPGWAESTAINTIEPSPVDETSDDGRLSFELGEVAAGKSFILFMQFQVNPTNVGRRSQDVSLYDGDTRLLTIHRTVTIWP